MTARASRAARDGWSRCRVPSTGLQPLAALVLVFTLTPIRLTAQPATALETQVKAAYLLNFGRFITWTRPGAAGADSFPICVLGRDPFGSVLDAVVSGEQIDGLPVVARRLDRPEEAGACRIVFVGGSERSRVKSILQTLAATPTLTVSDIPRFLEDDGMIELVSDRNRVRFSVNIPPADRAGLSFGSELLRVAMSVRMREGTTVKP